MSNVKAFILATAAPALLLAGTAEAAATRSVSARPAAAAPGSMCFAKVDASGRSVVTAWQRTNCANLAKRQAAASPGVGPTVSEVARRGGFMGMGGAGPFVIGALVVAGLGIGIAAGGDNSPGG